MKHKYKVWIKLFVCLLMLVGAGEIYAIFQMSGTLLGGKLPAGQNSVSPPYSRPSASAVQSVQNTPSKPVEHPNKPAVTGIFASYSDAAQKKLAEMSLSEKVGQLFIFRCPDSNAMQAVKKYQPCGYVLMASHFKGKTREQVVAMTDSFQSASTVKMVLCADEEGGTVVRVSGFSALSPAKFQSPQTVFQLGGMSAIYKDTVRKSQLLLSLGINLNLAPVADVSTNPKDFIYDRSFGKPAAQTAQFVTTFVNAANSQKISSALKHFPGYGNNADTHTGIAYDKRSYAVFEKSDFLPFSAGIQAGAQCVLVSHNIVECMDPARPASLSPKVHQILRDTLHFTGIVMTDDLVMDAIRDFTKGKNPAVDAFQAGNDILLSSNMEEDYQSLYAAVCSGEISEARVEQSVLRILAWKYAMKIIR